MIQLPTLLCPLQPFIEFFPKFDSSSNLEMLENLISVATLIRAYLVEKNGEKNSRSYMFIRDCRVYEHSVDNLLQVFKSQKDSLYQADMPVICQS